MNIYFLVEGLGTEKTVYPRWLSHLIPGLEEVTDPFTVSLNNYYIFSGNGYPALLDNHLINAISDVNNIPGFNFFVICLDADEALAEERKQEVLDIFKEKKLKFKNKTELIIIVQNKCIESWFLGNKRVYSRQPNSAELRKYNNFYNVQENDPELMTAMDDFNTSAQFHAAYLKEMLMEKNIHYSKKKPNAVCEVHYLEEIIDRQKKTNHLLSFRNFLDFCEKVKNKMR